MDLRAKMTPLNSDTFVPGQFIASPRTLFLVLKQHNDKSVDLICENGEIYERQRILAATDWFIL